MSDWRNFNRNTTENTSLDEHVRAGRPFWRTILEFDATFLNLVYRIQQSYGQGFPSNKIAIIGVPKLSFAESEFYWDCPDGGSGRHVLT